MRILAVDDSPTVLELLHSTLETAGHDILTAKHGREGLESLEEGDVDLIISDLNMVVMSGFEFLQQVRKHPLHMSTPFVFLTTDNDPGLKAAARDAGATAWIAKPFSPEALVQFVDRFRPVT